MKGFESYKSFSVLGYYYSDLPRKNTFASKADRVKEWPISIQMLQKQSKSLIVTTVASGLGIVGSSVFLGVIISA